MLIKLGEANVVTQSDIQPIENVFADSDILERFKKFAAELKTIAPLAKDFLYFTAIMMHAAESSLLDGNGEIKKDASGNPLEVKWEKVGSDGLRWVCSDKNIRPFKNANADIFPESELIVAHKKWIGRPLCLDHKSSSVDMIRGVIVDTYYDRKHKRVIALCALDKQNYPDLARKVATGYAASVSMGTAVGRAICTEAGCHRVARVESDFCDHMRNKSCYGEINCDLSPIELSIVVNGADPGAKIKHIIAKDLGKAADSLHEYMETKMAQGNVSQEELTSIKKDLESLTERVTKLVEASSFDDSKDSNDTNYGTTQSTKEMAESAQTETAQPPPNPNNYLVDWASKVDDLRVKLSTLQDDLKVLIKLNDKEPTMTNSSQKKEAYFQGGGGLNEPTPGKPRYPEMTTGKTQNQIRETEDKQMVGQSPFPDVGPVDGMHPGPASAGESEEARKRRLQRLAEAERRQLRRQAALEKAKEMLADKKEAYFHGGGGPNEPTPGKPKYPEMTIDGRGYQDIRDKEDKQMVGQKPFPDVGKVDGLHPSPASAEQSDELKRKEMLARASLKAKFVKAVTASGQTDIGRSRWDIFAGKDLILSATVNEITGGNTSDVLYGSIATEKFGMDVLKKIKSEGFDAARASLVKSAQAAPQAPTMAPAGGPGPADAAPQAPNMGMPTGDMEPPMGDEPGSGSPKEQVDTLIDTIENAASDLREAVSAMEGEVPELEGVKPADEAAFAAPEAKVASVGTLQSMRKSLNGMLTDSMKEAVASLGAHVDELKLASEVYQNKFASLNREQKKYLDTLTADAVRDAKSTVADSLKLMSAFVHYAHGTDGLMKRAAREEQMKYAQVPSTPSTQTQDVKPGEALERTKDMPMIELVKGLPQPSGFNAPPPDASKQNMFADDAEHEMPEHVVKSPISKLPGTATESKPQAPRGSASPHSWQNEPFVGDVGQADDNNVMVELPPGADIPAGAKAPKTAKFDLTTKEGRAAYRMKLAQKGAEWNEMTGKAHPKGGQVPSGMGGPEGNLDKVETVEEVHDAMMQLAQLPPKVRKQAEAIRQLVSEGKLQAQDVDLLVAEGVDPAAVGYWKKFWSEAKDSESKEFATKLTQETARQKAAEELKTQEVRIKRAYDLAYEMRDRGIIDGTQIKTQVDEILGWNDVAYESTKRIIAKQAIKKQAMPQVGLLHSGDVILPAAEQTQERADLSNVFDSYFAGRKF
jgi:hypothetical protein